MYEIDEKDTYYMCLPANLQDIDAQCFSYALFLQMKKYVKLSERLNLWGNLENAKPEHYDYIAACMGAPYYRSEFSNTVKLQLIKHAYETRRYAGTRQGIESLINIIFEKAIFRPWYTYDGKQYRFKILVYDMLTEDATLMFTNVLQKVKAERSVMDMIEAGRESYGQARTGAAAHADTKQACIEENNDVENIGKSTSCTGATTYASTKQAHIIEDNDSSNTAMQRIIIGSAEGNYSESTEQEDNSLANDTGTDIHTGATIYDGGQKYEAIIEDNSMES